MCACSLSRGGRLTVQDILGGMRSACTYVGARSLKELSKELLLSELVNKKIVFFPKT